jgi:hypothetical protein
MSPRHCMKSSAGFRGVWLRESGCYAADITHADERMWLASACARKEGGMYCMKSTMGRL